MHEDILGYLLGALEPHEMRRVAQWLREDAAAREELAKLERSLKLLEDGLDPVEPPPSNLVGRTLANLPPLPAAPSAPCTPAPQSTTGQSVVHHDSVSVGLAPMRSSIDTSPNSTMTWIDWAGGALAAAVLLGLLLPSLAQGRLEARKATCHDQLRQLGTALTQFVMRNQQNRLPAVAESGPEAFAGNYAIRLHQAGLMENPSIRWCPSIDQPTNDNGVDPRLDEMVSTEDLYIAPVDQLRRIQRTAGGDYAYNLGVIDGNDFKPPRYESRSSFAVMSDAPMIGMPGGTLRADLIGHSGLGINVLYESGRVQFLSLSSLHSMPDHPLLNHHGRVEAGVNIDDASLAPSSRPPFVDVPQR
jgi:hypothetical protein